MQNIIELVQSGDITNNKLLQSLVEYENKIVDEYNDALDRNDEIAKKLEDAHFTLSKQHQALLKQQSNEEILTANQVDYDRANKQMKSMLQVNDHKLKVANKELKALKEQVKRNKAAMSVRDTKITKLEKQAAEHKKSAKSMGELVQIARIGDEQLLMFPVRQVVNGKRSAVLLYTNGNGCYLSGYLEGEEAGFSTFINRDSKLADKTKAMIENNVMKPSSRIIEISTEWLYRVNVMQNCDIKTEDLRLITK